MTPRHFAWQACHLATSTFVLRGRRNTWRHLPSFCVAGVALGHIHLRFAWHAWHLWHWAGSGGALEPVLVAGDAAALRVAGVSLGDIYLRFAWQACHLATSTFVLRGRRGTWRHPPSFCVAGVALMALVGALGSVLVAGDAQSLFCGTRGTWSHPPSLCVAGVALGNIHLRFVWQAWHYFVTHPHTLFHIFHTQLCHPPSLTDHLSNITLSHTNFHTPSLTRPLSHTIFVTHHLSHPTLSHTIFDTPSFTRHFVTQHL